ncbi:MAG: 3'(2'),5'-bisphosphate nucleotidase CysQ [Pseudomonadota bacterium]
MPDPDLDLLIKAARAAGRVACRFAPDTTKTWEKPDNAGPVTEADLAVNDTLHDILQSERPDYGWLSEESEDDPARLSAHRLFIVDPIDGTRSFIDGSNTWAHSLAVAKEGRVTAAVIYLPKRDMLYAAAARQGATLNDAPIQPRQTQDLATAQVLSVKHNFKPEFWQGTPPDLTRAYRPSLAYRMALVAEGRFDAMITFRPSWEWDIAAGDLILREAGACTSDRAGQPLMFNNPTPKVAGVLAANPRLHAQIANQLTFED